MLQLRVLAQAVRALFRRRGSTPSRPRSASPARSRGARRRWRRRRWPSSQQRSSGFAAQPAAQEARHEGVAGAQHVEHLDRETRARRRPRRALSGIAPGNADAALRRRACRRSARRVFARIARSAAMVSVVPPRMWISSSVPTIRSQSGRTCCSCAVTAVVGDEAVLAHVARCRGPTARR